MKTRVTIIGAGNMGQAMAKALIQEGSWSVTLVDRPDKKIKSISGAKLAKSIQTGLKDAQVILLAVKPQDGKNALASMRTCIPPSAILISIMVGATLKGLVRESGHKKIVRAMPNMPAQIGLGMTVWCATKELGLTQRRTVQNLLESFGEAQEVKQEQLVDVATAISGSGPAYVFALAEYMQEAGKRLGLSPDTARRVTIQTLVGSSHLLKHSEEDAGVLRKKVTSKRGTTEAAFKIFDSKRTKQIYLTALKAAFARAKKVSNTW